MFFILIKTCMALPGSRDVSILFEGLLLFPPVLVHFDIEPKVDPNAQVFLQGLFRVIVLENRQTHGACPGWSCIS